jgi:putative hydrolase of the HAD superfamily
VIQYALFDLDDTLYPRDAGVLRAIGGRIEEYLVVRMGMAPEEAARLRAEYRSRYGTTLAGLLAHHAVDADDYLAYVHAVPVESLLRPDAALAAALGALPWEPVIFTNSDRAHTERVLNALGVRRHFARIFDIRDMGYRQKPDPLAYRHVLAALGVPGSACLFVDDSLVNLQAGKAWQMTTVWVGPDAAPAEGVDYCIAQAADIASVAARIRVQEGLPQRRARSNAKRDG